MVSQWYLRARNSPDKSHHDNQPSQETRISGAVEHPHGRDPGFMTGIFVATIRHFSHDHAGHTPEHSSRISSPA